MNKIILIFITVLMFTVISRELSYKYNYTDHKVYIYKFINKNNDYNIIFKDAYQLSYNIPVDSIKYFEYANNENRKKYYKLRSFDDGRRYIIKTY